jgi:hypothetical protein
MPEVKFTKEDLLERSQLAPGWRTFKIKSVEERPGKSDPTATVWEIALVVTVGPETGVPVRHWFSEKAMGRMVDFIKCFLQGGKIEEGKSYNLDQTVNRLVDGYAQYDIQSGFNTIKDWRPSTPPAQAPATKGA